MKKNKYRNDDFNETDLPSNRREQFFDLLKTNFRTLFYLGTILFVCFIPYWLVYFAKNTALSSLTEVPKIASTILFYDLLQLVCFFIIFITLSGVFQIYKVISWNEGLFFKHDFFKGIKQNWKRFLFYGFLFGVCCTVLDLINFLLSSDVLYYVTFGFFQFVLFPTLLFLLAFENFFSNTFISMLTNSFKTFLSHFLISLLFSISFMSVLFLFLIKNYLILIICLILIVVFIFPIYLLCFHQYSLHIFDKFISGDYEKIKNKGLTENKD